MNQVRNFFYATLLLLLIITFFNSLATLRISPTLATLLVINFCISLALGFVNKQMVSDRKADAWNKINSSNTPPGDLVKIIGDENRLHPYGRQITVAAYNALRKRGVDATIDALISQPASSRSLNFLWDLALETHNPRAFSEYLKQIHGTGGNLITMARECKNLTLLNAILKVIKGSSSSLAWDKNAPLEENIPNHSLAGRLIDYFSNGYRYDGSHESEHAAMAEWLADLHVNGNLPPDQKAAIETIRWTLIRRVTHSVREIMRDADGSTYEVPGEEIEERTISTYIRDLEAGRKP